MKPGDKFFWLRGWRWLWFMREENGYFIFEDAYDVPIALTGDEVRELQPKLW